MSDKHARLPSETFSFTLLKPEPKPSLLGPRLGTVALKNRATLQTPHYIALSSRGAVPHISQDVMRKHTNVKGIHVALEDCELICKGYVKTVY
jgi:queuine tRNA-ribosyltransferase subunit QTRTD1